MNKDIDITDWGRIFLGDVPLEFMIEVIIRMVFIYIVLVGSLRLMGRRMEAMLSRGEMVSLVTLGASVGVAIHTPERGLLPSSVVILIILGMQTLQSYLTSRHARAEKLLLGQISTLVMDGCLLIDEMKKSRITRERLFAALRLKGIKNLGTIKRVYFEAKGVFSVVTCAEKTQNPGLCILPDMDGEFRGELKYDTDAMACRSCGAIGHTGTTNQCHNCGAKEWERAIIENE